jgi:ATP-dependent Clp protease protease subunit
MKKRMAELTAEQTGKSIEQILIDGDRDNWFTAQEALKYGFVDHLREYSSEVIGGGGTNDHVTEKDVSIEPDPGQGTGGAPEHNDIDPDTATPGTSK